MKALRFALSLLCWTLLFSLWGAAAQAAGFAPALTVEEGRPGGVVEVAFPYDGSLGEVAAFRTQVEYDPTVLEYLRPTYGESVQAGTVTTQNTPGKVASVYTAPAGGPYLAAEDAIVYRFRILESAVPGLATVFVSVFELSTPEPAAIPEDVDVSLSFQVLEPPSSDARLLSLAPDHGQLQPAFDPDVFAYTMTVPYEVEAITFTAEPVPGAACRVNRKNLGSGGSDTLFRITVTAEDGETKNEYQVTVHRQEKEEEEKPELSALADALAVDVPKGALEVDGAVVIPEERGVNAALLDGDGLGPGAADVIGPHKEVAAGADVGGDHVKPPVVVADGGGENAAGSPAALQGVLAGAGEHVAQLLPVEQIAAVPQGHPGEELKGAVHQVVVLAHPADAGIGVKTGEDGVFK